MHFWKEQSYKNIAVIPCSYLKISNFITSSNIRCSDFHVSWLFKDRLLAQVLQMRSEPICLAQGYFFLLIQQWLQSFSTRLSRRPCCIGQNSTTKEGTETNLLLLAWSSWEVHFGHSSSVSVRVPFCLNWFFKIFSELIIFLEIKAYSISSRLYRSSIKAWALTKLRVMKIISILLSSSRLDG